MLSTPERLADPHNHAAPILDYFEDDGETQDAFVVMPLLRYFDDPPFTTVNEPIDFVRQILEVRMLRSHTQSPIYFYLHRA